jgi:hypothetical protein
LLIGAAVAMWCAARPPQRAGSRRALAWLSVPGLVVVGWTVVQTRDTSDWLYRGGMTLVAVASVAVVVGALVPGPVRWLLERRPLPAIGLISYGLYLWHWPIYLTLTPGRTHVDGTALVALRVAVSFVVATLSFVLVERPLRHGTLWARRERRSRRALFVPVAAAATVVLVAATAYARVPAPSRAELAKASPVPEDASAALPATAARAQAPATARQVRVLLTGDSVAFTLAYWGPSAPVAKQLWTTSAAILGCGIVVGSIVSEGKVIKESSDCPHWEDRYRTAMRQANPEVSVLMIGAWEVFDRRLDGRDLRVGTPEMATYLTQQLDTARTLLTAKGAKLVVLNVPCYRPPDLGLATAGSAERADPQRVAWVNRVLGQFVAAHPGTTMLDLRGLLCPGGKFLAQHDGKPIRTDDGIHLTQDGAHYVWDWLAPQLVQLAGGAR